MRGIVFWTSMATVALNAAAADLHLLYRTPAATDMRGWEHQSLPIGNGWFGVNVFGDVTNDWLQVTHNAVMTNGPEGYQHGCLCDALDIRLVTDHADCTNYSRGLDLATATAWTAYTAGGVDYRREVFASYPDKAMAVRLTASRKGALAFRLDVLTPYPRPFGTKERAAETGRRGVFAASADGREVSLMQELEHFGIRFDSEFVIETDGEVSREWVYHSTAAGSVAVKNATTATIYFACETNYRLSPAVFLEPDPRRKLTPTDPSPEAKRLAAAAAKKGYEALRRDHLDDVARLMGAARIDLGADAADAAVPMDELLARYRAKRDSRYLEEVYFQYGRYLLMSSSRPGTLPANLQGVWAAHQFSPWGSGYWHNINVQMNYWPAFSCNLEECFRAYADFNRAFRPSTRKEACHYLSWAVSPDVVPKDGEAGDLWAVGTSGWPYGVSGSPGGHSGPGTGPLTTKLFTDWWLFTRDETALREHVWPVLHGMADFLERCVVETNGLYLSAFSASPEQYCDGTWQSGYYRTVGCAFDQQMIWENNHDLLMLADVLGTNDAVVAKAREQIGRYDPIQVGGSGQIKEFREEDRYGEIGEYHHRHISQLVGLMPGTQVTRERPDLVKAARVTLTERGDKSTGWALAHRMNAWARAFDGDHAHLLLGNLLSERTNDNLWDMHPPFQIDGNFGATAGIAEMLLQSHAGYIDLLPALPAAWAKKGSFAGLCARGGFVVMSCEWRDGVPISATVWSRAGLVPDVRFAGRKFRPVVPPCDGVYVYRFNEIAVVKGSTGKDIQQAVDAAAARGGGMVYVPAGEYPTGTIWLKGGVELHLAKGARLLGRTKSEDYDDFPDEVCAIHPEGSKKVLLAAYDAKDIAVTGEGVIDGQGLEFFADKKIPWGRFFMKPPVERPRMVQFVRCRGVRLEGVTFKDSPCWTMLIRLCDDITVNGITVTADQRMINNDGIDFDGCRRIRVGNSTFRTGDDCLILRAMRDASTGTGRVVCEDVVVSNCTLNSACQTIRMGCPSDDTIRNALFKDIRAEGNNGIFFDYPTRYLRPDDEGYMDIRDITFDGYAGKFGESAVQIVSEPGVKVRAVDGIVFRNFDVESAKPLRLVGNAGHEIGRVTLENFRAKVKSGEPLEARGCKGLIFKGVTLNGAARPDGPVTTPAGSDEPLKRPAKPVSWESTRAHTDAK